MSERDSEPQPHGNVPHPLDAPAGAHPPVQQHHDEHGHDQHDHGVRQMEDQPNVRMIFLVAVVGIVITVVSVYISWGFQLTQEAQINAAPVPAAGCFATPPCRATVVRLIGRDNSPQRLCTAWPAFS